MRRAKGRAKSLTDLAVEFTKVDPALFVRELFAGTLRERFAGKKPSHGGAGFFVARTGDAAEGIASLT